MIDCHNHILPGIDDGSLDVDYSIAMARVAVKAGIKAVIATPHHLNGVYFNTRRQVLKSVMNLRSAIAAVGIELDVFPGSELHLVPELPEQLLSGDALTYADQGQAALVELPKQTIPMGTETILEQLLYNGITPVIAHPERNAVLLAQPERVADWVKGGCKLQLTAQSCAGELGPIVQAVSRRWCKEGLVHLLASDAHRTTTRPPDIGTGAAAVTCWIGEKAVQVLTADNPARLINGKELLSPPVNANNMGWRQEFIRKMAYRQRKKFPTLS